MTDVVDHFDQADGLSQSHPTDFRAVRGENIDHCGVMAVLSRMGGNVLSWSVKNKRRLKPWAMLGALLLFSVGLFLSLQNSPDILERIKFGPLLVILLVTLPISLTISTVDFQVMARLSGVSIKFWSAAEIVLYSRAANLLPIPGSFAVRMTALKAQGATFKWSGELMFLFTVIWGGIGFCYSAAWLTFQAPIIFTISFASTGLALLSACFWFVQRNKLEIHAVLTAAILRFALIVLEAVTLMMAVQAIGVDVQYHHTAILVVASFLASVVPAGIGVRETIIAALAPIAGIGAATGFLAGVAARATGLAFLATCTTLVFILSRRRAEQGARVQN